MDLCRLQVREEHHPLTHPLTLLKQDPLPRLDPAYYRFRNQKALPLTLQEARLALLRYRAWIPRQTIRR